MRDVSICAPDIYYGAEMQEFIRRRCNDEDKQWIYHMLESDLEHDSNEVVYIREAAWLLCKDVHQGMDFRLLVIFTDRQLQTLRDLRAEHIPLLMHIKQRVYAWLTANVTAKQACKYKIYFHYMPSVYQLHAHVCVPGQFYNYSRSHNLTHVVRNLAQDSLWYHHALIMFTVNKTLRQLQLYRVLNAESFVPQESSLKPEKPPQDAGLQTHARATHRPHSVTWMDPVVRKPRVDRNKLPRKNEGITDKCYKRTI